jgi:hypothetical protein
VIVRVEIVSRLMQPFEAPAIELAREGFILALDKVFGCHVANEELLVVDLPGSAMWLY